MSATVHTDSKDVTAHSASGRYELAARTEAGARFVRLAEEHADVFATRAEGHDRTGTFPVENFDDMRASGFMAGSAPERYGGLGVESLHDLMVGMSRIARGDASTAIAANMHVTGVAVVVRMMKRARNAGDFATIKTLEELLAGIGAGKIVMCFPHTEPGTDLATPMTELTPVEGGYRLNGKKIFGTISPIAHLFFPNARIPKPEGGYLLGTAMVERGAAGLEVLDNWDAMGMRASGSNDIVFNDVFIPADRVFGIKDNYGRIGRGFADFALTANVPLIASFLGVAEASRNLAVKTVTAQRKGMSRKLLADRIPIQQLVAEMDIDIAVGRAMVDRVGDIADAFLARYPDGDAPVDESNALMKEVQCMKYVVNRKAVEIVDRSMIVCGGAAYMNKHPLSRLYRDVRAGPFMQPFAPYEALEYIGKVALGFEPILDR